MALSGNYMDDQLDIMCEGFFDNIDDLLDFSVDDQPLGMPADSLINIPLPGQFPALDSKECTITANSQETKISNDIGIDEDWISDFLYDSTLEEEIKKSKPPFQSFSPTSVLEPNNHSNTTTETAISSSSSSTSPPSQHTTSLPPPGPMKAPVPARARSKRPRRPIIPILAPTDGPPSIPTILADLEPAPKRIKIVKRTSLAALNPNIDEGSGVRKCMHCGIHKTPQWRAGPMGPKTLCNACGVRYKSGRLFPEYRPAASPTFMPSVHSNSHKKVVEMRNKVIERRVAKEYNPAAKNCDLLKYIRV